MVKRIKGCEASNYAEEIRPFQNSFLEIERLYDSNMESKTVLP